MSALALSDQDYNSIPLTPAFSSATTSYTALVDNSVYEMTVSPTKDDDNGLVEFLDENDVTVAGRTHHQGRAPGSA